ncbi:MAG: CoA-binding protein [SAR324 cluster bacterium]|nr:CoA-binding protein [SAR324 cluster bacterium]
MKEMQYSDTYIRGILREVEVIAMVGCSANWNRPSNFAMKYLQGKNYRIIPVNPRYAGEKIQGETVYGDLADIPVPYQMVDLFLASKNVGPVVDKAIELAEEKGISVIWMQLGVQDDAAAQRAEQAHLKVVMNRCPKIEYGRLYGELGWGGVNSGIISAKRRKVRSV